MAVLPANWPSSGGSYSGTDVNLTENTVNAIPAKGVAVVVATTALPAGTYNNGTGGVGATFTVTATGSNAVDGHTLAANELVLVAGQASAVQNGLYTVTVAGTGGVATVLTRATTMNSSADFPGSMVIVGPTGTLYPNTVWFCTATGVPVMGSTNMPFTQPRVRPVKSVVSTTSSATPAINVDTCSVFKLTALATGITGWTITGTATDQQELTITIKDNGTPQPLVWPSPFLPSGAAGLPNITPASKKMTLKFIYDSDNTSWVLMAVDANGY